MSKLCYIDVVEDVATYILCDIEPCSLSRHILFGSPFDICKNHSHQYISSEILQNTIELIDDKTMSLFHSVYDLHSPDCMVSRTMIRLYGHDVFWKNIGKQINSSLYLPLFQE